MNQILHQMKNNQKGLLCTMMLLFLTSYAFSQVSVTLDGTNLTCGGISTGSITANPSGGWSPYTYYWSNGATTQTIDNLPAGFYSVTVTDGDGATANKSITLTSPTEVTGNISISGSSSPFTLAAQGSGGVSPYTYEWNTGQTSAVINNVTSGTYCVTIVDSNLCGTIKCKEVAGCNVNVVITVNHVSCPGANDGTATAIVSGGSGPYSYIWDNGGTSQTITGLSQGVYKVTVTDANGCMGNDSGLVSGPGGMINLNVNGTNPSCAGSNNGTATANATGGVGPYSFNWSNGQTGSTITGLNGGTYYVTLTDANSCQQTGNITLSNQGSLNLNVTSTNAVCQGSYTGNASAFSSGGIQPYYYNWSNGGNTQTISNLGPGTYTVTVTDGNGCSQIRSTTINTSQGIYVTISSSGGGCNGGGNASATANASGGSAPYYYQWSNGSNNQTITNLNSGTYTVTVTDNAGCSDISSTTISSGVQLTGDIAKQDVTCFGGNDGRILVSGWGGTPLYTYAWSTGLVETEPAPNAGSELTNLSAGTYSVTITDQNGCSTIGTIIINQPSQLLVNINSTDASCGSSSGGSATASVSGGTPGYSYQWSNGSNSQTINNLSSGTYTVTVTDSRSCTKVSAVTISSNGQVNTDIVSTNPTCFGGTNGSILVTGWGGTAPYVFSLSNGQTQAEPYPNSGVTFSNLSAGTYLVSLVDANGCPSSTTAILTQPSQLTVNIYSTDASCSSSNGGSATVTANGGTPGYNYQWSNGSNSQTINNLTAGTYTVTVTDANFCTRTTSVTVNSSGQISISLFKTNVTCFGGNNGTIIANGSGGTAPYTFTLNGQTITESSPNAGVTFTNISSGSYTVMVVDANGCTSGGTALVGQPSQLFVSATSTDAGCGSNSGGSATAFANGGTSGYNYQWSNGASSQTINNLSQGTYTVTVTDANFCTRTTSVTINGGGQINADVVKTDVTCFQQSNGTILATGWGGTAPYTFTLNNGAPINEPFPNAGITFSGLNSGTYTVSLVDANGCTASTTVVINQPSQLVANATSTNASCNANDGMAFANGVGGITPYTYFWNTGATSSTLNNLAPGTYVVTVTDANGCTAASTTNVTQAQGFDLNMTSTNISCAAGGTASAMAEVLGGSAPFSYQWSNGGSSQTISNLTSGTYNVTVTDNNGCVSTGSTTIVPGSDFTTDIAIHHVSCFGGNDGSVLVSGWGGTPLYTYTWSTGLMETESNPNAGSELTGLTAGTYTVTVTDAAGCSLVETIIIMQPSQLTVIASGTDATCDNASGSASANASGGTSPYSYSWSNGGSTQTINNLGSGTYTVTVTDANFCTATSTVTINGGNNLTVNVTGTNTICNGANNGMANVTTNGGNAPFSYQWSNGATSNQINNLTVGTYSVTVTDANGCTQTGSITITPSSDLNINVTGNTTTCGASESGTALANVTGGTAPYTYNWSNGATTSSLNNLAAGTYTVTVTDTNGCFNTGSITITNGNLNINVVKENIDCFGESTGSATLTVTGGQVPYNYNWSNGTTTATADNLSAGTYTVTVTDVNGCAANATIIITEAPDLTVSINSNNPSCSGSNTGSATAVPSGGTPTYTYNWSNGESGATISNLTAGTYTVTVTDANGCTEIETITISQGSILTLSTDSTPASCEQSNGSASVTADGTAPYTYSWSNGGSTSTINNVPAGTYTVSVTDINGCFETTTVTVSGQNSPNVSVTTSGDVCDGTSTGTATANASGGQIPYTYEWSNGGSTMMITGLEAGTYIVTITDANGCTDIASGSINTAASIQVNITASDISCFGENDGSLQGTASSGQSPYTYDWSNGTSNPNQNNLPSGTYNLTVTDANGCTGTASATINEPSQLVVNLNEIDEMCSGASDGQITANVSGGTPNYTYNWNNGTTTATIQNLSPGTYRVTVTDSEGCTEIVSTTIGEGTSISVNVTTQSTCQGSNNGSATASVSGGQSPYTYNWSNGASGQTINNLSAGTYTVTVTDANGCQDTDSATVNSNAGVSCYIQILSPIGNGSDGIIQVQANGGQSPYTYNWSNGQTTQSISNLSAGTYTVTITDANGCTTTCNVTLNNPAKIGDMVWNDHDQDGIMDNGEPGIGGVRVDLSGTDNQGNTITGTTYTDGDGKYIFTGLDPGNYRVRFILDSNLGFFLPSPANQGGNDELDSDADPNTGMTQFINLSEAECDLSLDAGFYELCTNVTNAGSIGYDQDLCADNADPDPIISLAPATGGQGNLEYLWMRANLNVPFSNSAWEIIPGATGESYDPGSISEDTYFVRCARRDGCGGYVESNVVHMTIVYAPPVILGPERVCKDDVVTFSAGTTSGSNVTYTWNFGSGASPSNTSGQFVNVSWSSTGNKQITLTTQLNGCSYSSTQTVNVTIMPSVCGFGLVIDATVVNQQDVMVEWELPLNSSDTIMYYVERSADGEDFHEMGQMLDPKSEVFSMEYEFMDLNPKMGYSYYRVAYVDNFGVKHYSNIEEVIVYGQDIIHVFPNPTFDEVNVEVLDDYYTRISIEVIDPLGRFLTRTRLGDDEFKTTIDLSPYPQGIYFLRINYSDVDSRLVKVIKR